MSKLEFGPLAKMGTVEYIVVHTYGPVSKDGVPLNVDQSAATVHAHHKGLGTSGYGYHGGFRMDGTLEEGRPVDKAGAHVKGLNDRSEGYACAGNGNVADFTPEQYAKLIPHLAARCRARGLGADRVLGHHECNGIPGVPRITKSCPGSKVDMDAIRRRVAALLAPEPVVPEIPLPKPSLAGVPQPPVVPPFVEPIRLPEPEPSMGQAAAIGWTIEAVRDTARQAAEWAGEQATPDLRQSVAEALVKEVWPKLRERALRVLPAWLAGPLLAALHAMLPALVQRALAARA